MTRQAPVTRGLADQTPTIGRASDRWRGGVALLAVVAAHVLILVGLQVKGPSTPHVADLDSVTVSLIPALLLSQPPAPVTRPMTAARPAPTQPASVQGADAPDFPAPEPKPQQMAVDATAQPFALSAASPKPLAVSQVPPPMPAQASADCNLAHTVAAALQSNPRVLASLSRIPRRAKSVANAIMLWDGQWPAATAFGGPTILAPLRDAVTDAVRSAPVSCQAKIEAGPRLMPIEDNLGTTVVAIGSGLWRWSDLVSADIGGQSITR